MRVRYTPRATNDLLTILEYLHERSPKGKRNARRAIRKTIELISQFPESGRRSTVGDSRVLPAGKYPYLIYWIVEVDETWIVHIRDGRRKPWGSSD